jgi:hypothetical protein
MDASTASEQERAEVHALLQSGLFDRSPRLGTFFRYICERHLEGRADEIKEYSIAVEALGRSADFDPKKDSIVRVEAHRLRRRLEEYYSGEGLDHPVSIVIPNGQYRPQFVVHPSAPTAAVPEASPATAVENLPGLVPAAPRPFTRRWPVVVLTALAAAACILLGVRAYRRPAATAHRAALQQQPINEIWRGPAAEPAEGTFRMLAGYHGPSFTDRQGHTWTADAYFTGGRSLDLSRRFIECQPDPHLLKAERTGQFQYDIPLHPGAYELRLGFAETEFGQSNPGGGGESTRIFRVSMNGHVLLSAMDPLAEAGAPNRFHVRVFKDVSPATDGKLHLRFDPLTGSAFLNSLELLPSPPGRIHPVRIVAQNKPVIDSDGRLWAADEYYIGGNLVFRRNQVVNPVAEDLYQGERYGNFAYHIPLAPGKYRLTLHFAETWFGMPESQEPALNSRIFNVFANGTALLRDFQIVKDAGGPNRGVAKVFGNLEPNAQGILRLEFVPVRNYAEVNAIEVVEMN